MEVQASGTAVKAPVVTRAFAYFVVCQDRYGFDTVLSGCVMPKKVVCYLKLQRMFIIDTLT